MKVKVFCDFDDVLYLSSKKFVEIENKKRDTNKDWKKTNWKFTSLFPDINEKYIHDVFSGDEFYNDENCIDWEMISILNENLKLDIIDLEISTIGCGNNKSNKRKFINKYIYSGKDIEMSKIPGTDKSKIDMKNSIFIDDNIHNLRKSNAKVKILLKREYKSNHNQILPNDDVYVAYSADEINDVLKFYYNIGEVI